MKRHIGPMPETVKNVETAKPGDPDISLPTDYFTILKLQSPSYDVRELH